MDILGNLTHISRISDIPEGPERMTLPIEGYEKLPIVTLERAVEPLKSIMPDVEDMVSTVKPNCKKPADNLSIDESASIMLYTLEWSKSGQSSCYKMLNETLRDGDRSQLKPWFLYLKLFITALSKLPSEDRRLFRGVKKDLTAEYNTGLTITWWAFSSCTTSIDVLEGKMFLGKTGPRTLFAVDCRSGRSIHQHSMVKKENEVLLPLARKFQVVAKMNMGNGLNMIQLVEIDPAYSFPEFLSSNHVLVPKKPNNSGPQHNEKVEQIVKKLQSGILNLSGEQISDLDMKMIIQQGLVGKQCKILNLMATTITQYGLSILADALRDNKFLQQLNISNTDISDSGILELSSTMNMSVLQQVDLTGTNISDEGAQYLAKMLDSNTTLLELLISENQIGDNGVKTLANSLMHNNRSLQVLNLSANQNIGDESINSLTNMMKSNSTLKKLDLRHTGLSNDGEGTLHAAAKSKKGFQLWLSHFM